MVTDGRPSDVSLWRTLDTGGSSTGSAVALAAGMTAAAIGAESFGSIVSNCHGC